MSTTQLEAVTFETTAPTLERIVVTIHGDRIERMTYPRLAKRRLLKAVAGAAASEAPLAMDTVMLAEVTSVSWAIVGGVRTIAVFSSSGVALTWRGSNDDIDRAVAIVRERSAAALRPNVTR